MALLATVERVLNRHISESTAATRRLGALEGQSFAVAIAGPDIRIVLNVRDGHVHVRVSADEPVDATVRGSPLLRPVVVRSSVGIPPVTAPMRPFVHA